MPCPPQGLRTPTSWTSHLRLEVSHLLTPQKRVLTTAHVGARVLSRHASSDGRVAQGWLLYYPYTAPYSLRSAGDRKWVAATRPRRRRRIRRSPCLTRAAVVAAAGVPGAAIVGRLRRGSLRRHRRRNLDCGRRPRQRTIAALGGQRLSHRARERGRPAVAPARRDGGGSGGGAARLCAARAEQVCEGVHGRWRQRRQRGGLDACSGGSDLARE